MQKCAHKKPSTVTLVFSISSHRKLHQLPKQMKLSVFLLAYNFKVSFPPFQDADSLFQV